MSPMQKNMVTISDSVAIAILGKNALIRGVGNELHLHTDIQETCNQKLPIALRGKVHGIIAGTGGNQDKLLVHGEKEYLLLQRREQHAFHLLHRGELTDWISTGKLLSSADHFVLLTAHSSALRLEYESAAGTCRVAERSSCSDKSTLYCSAVYGDQWNELVCFGGNAFGELLVWQPSETDAPLLKRILAHNGVIFSISYSARAHLLTTTSDDRSIRFWRVERNAPETWAQAKFMPLASGYGHVARVFQGRIIKNAEQFYGLTVGEDSYICIWHSNGKLVHKCRQQFGAIIWNFEYDEAEQMLYTVGSTGNIISYCLQEVFDQDIQRKIAVPEVLPPLSDGMVTCGHNKMEHYVAKIRFLTPHLLVALTNKNQLLYCRIGEDWQLIEEFRSSKCSVLEVHQNHVAICGYKRLTLYRFTDGSTVEFEKVYDFHDILNGLIRAFKFLATNKFLICDDKGNCLLLHEQTAGVVEKHSIVLPKCKEPWLTSAALVEMQFLLMSNRQGNAFLYRWQQEERAFTLVYTLKHCHGNLGATLIKLVNNTEADAAFLKSVGHDGCVRHLKLCKISASLRIVKNENVPVAWVEALEELPGIGCELMLGFNDNHFVVWTKLYDFILELPCGGGHRCWDFCLQSEFEGGKPFIKLFFIKNKQVLFHEFRLFSHVAFNQILKLPPRNMWHVKPCNVLTCIEEPRFAPIIISGGDDNLLKISKCEAASNYRQLSQVTEVHSHISNIRALKVLKISDADYLIFSGGGRAQLCATKFNSRTLQIEELLNTSLKTQGENHTEKNFSFDPETRIMSLDVLNTIPDGCPDGGFTIFVGCSDGFVRRYQLNKNWQLALETEISYGRCILQVRLVESEVLLIAATDGFVCCSNLQLTHVEKLVQHHASGVNALDIRYSRVKRELQLLTGGDDQNVAYSRLTFAPSSIQQLTEVPKAEVLDKLHFNDLHNAQVTAVQISTCGRYAFSSGVDQNLFKVDLLTQQVVEEFHSCVADIKGLRLCASDEVCFLYGCGLQAHSFLKC